MTRPASLRALHADNSSGALDIQQGGGESVWSGRAMVRCSEAAANDRVTATIEIVDGTLLRTTPAGWALG